MWPKQRRCGNTADEAVPISRRQPPPAQGQHQSMPTVSMSKALNTCEDRHKRRNIPAADDHGVGAQGAKNQKVTVTKRGTHQPPMTTASMSKEPRTLEPRTKAYSHKKRDAPAADDHGVNVQVGEVVWLQLQPVARVAVVSRPRAIQRLHAWGTGGCTGRQ